jgi:hypothetical protein
VRVAVDTIAGLCSRLNGIPRVVAKSLCCLTLVHTMRCIRHNTLPLPFASMEFEEWILAPCPPDARCAGGCAFRQVNGFAGMDEMWDH